MKKIVSFGEVMMRLSPANKHSIKQAAEFESYFGGSEANVAYALALYGVPSAFVSVLPENPLGEAVIGTLYNKNLDTETIQFSNEGRLGIYFLQTDNHFRKHCLYDRSGSSFALSKREDYDWEKIFEGTSLFHFSGITPALSPEMPTICEDACIVAKRKGILVSIDINYRKNLWDKENASKVLQKLCQYADILFINEDEFSLLGINASANQILSDPLKFKSAAKKISECFSVQIVTSAKRLINSSSQLEIKAMIYQRTKLGFMLCVSKAFSAPPIDLSGAGDAYAAAMLYALHCENMSPKRAINFAAAACALKHHCKGDLNTTPLSTIKEYQKK